MVFDLFFPFFVNFLLFFLYMLNGIAKTQMLPFSAIEINHLLQKQENSHFSFSSEFYFNRNFISFWFILIISLQQQPLEQRKTPEQAQSDNKPPVKLDFVACFSFFWWFLVHLVEQLKA